MSETMPLNGWRYRAVVLSVLAAALGYLGFSLWGGWRDVSDAVARVGALGIVIALVMSLINYGLRFLRWQMYLRVLEHPVPWWPSLKIYLAGFALTTTPGKAGEALRSVLLQRWRVPYPQSFAAFFSERLSDLLAVALLALFGLTLYPQARTLIGIAAALVLLGVCLLTRRTLIEHCSGAIVALHGKVWQLVRHILQVMLEAQRCHRPAVLAAATALSLAAWGAEALAFHWILQWMGADIPLTFAVFVYAVSMLAGALSFMPGGLGGTEATMALLLTLKGVPGTDAIAATVLIRLTTLWFAVGIGAVFLTKWEN